MRIISNIDGTYKISSLPYYIVFPARPPRRLRVRHQFYTCGWVGANLKSPRQRRFRRKLNTEQATVATWGRSD